MNIYTAAQMTALEKRAAAAGIAPVILMENAAVNVCAAMLGFYDRKTLENVLVICGRGNNGGDGMAVARHLHNRGVKTSVLLVSGPKPLSGEAAVNREILRMMNIPVTETGTSSSSFRRHIDTATLVVDGLFGTGLKRDTEGVCREIMDRLLKTRKRVVSIDLPSGIDSDTGREMGRAVRAELTVATGGYKPGHFLFPGRECCGQLRLADISLPREYYDEKSGYELLLEEELAGLLARRKRDTHKGSYGHLAVIGGSPGMTGAPALAANAAMRSGTGLVTLFCGKSLKAVYRTKLLEVMTLTVEDRNGFLCRESVDKIVDGIRDRDAVVIGPGLSVQETTREMFAALLPELRIPVVIDADGINLLASDKRLSGKLKKNMVLTPHPGEMARLAGTCIEAVRERPVAVASAFAKQRGVHVVLKGATTLIASPDGTVCFSVYGNPGMATAGTGDVLAGVIGGFLAQGHEPCAAVRLGVVAHGSAGDAAREEKGEAGLLASDVTDKLPAILKKWEEQI